MILIKQNSAFLDFLLQLAFKIIEIFFHESSKYYTFPESAQI